MEQLTAEQAIEKIKSVKVKFLGIEVEKYGILEIRKKLESMARVGMISPKEFYRASKITWKTMGLSEGWIATENKRISDLGGPF